MGMNREKLRKKQQVRGCRLSQNSTRSKTGKNHRPRASMGTKSASESKTTTTAALGAKNPPLHLVISPGEKLKKTTGCCRSQNSTRSKKGKNHCPRASVSTKTASESKPTTTAALGAQNAPLHMGISPGQKLKKTTGPQLLSEPKFDPIKNGKKPPSVGCRGYQNCSSIKANHNCSSRSPKSTSPQGHFTW